MQWLGPPAAHLHLRGAFAAPRRAVALEDAVDAVQHLQHLAATHRGKAADAVFWIPLGHTISLLLKSF